MDRPDLRPRKPLVHRRLIPQLEIMQSRDTSLLHEHQHPVEIEADLVQPVAII